MVVLGKPRGLPPGRRRQSFYFIFTFFHSFEVGSAAAAVNARYSHRITFTRSGVTAYLIMYAMMYFCNSKL